jgi:hypothetical protein
MEIVDRQTAGLEGQGKVVRVKPGSGKEEVMAIGHTNQSMTFIPSVAVSLNDAGEADLVFLDCPGFLDNRGAEVGAGWPLLIACLRLVA